MPLRHSFTAAELVAHADGVRALARSLLADSHAAEDVVQEACLAALTRPPDTSTPPRAWFVGVVRNLSRRTHRSNAGRARRERAAARPEATSPGDLAVAQLETHRRLVEAVMGLRDPYRTAVVLRFFGGLAPHEIADRLDVPAATVNTWVHRGLATLRTRLESDRDDWRAALLPLFAIPRKAVPPLVPVAGAIAMTAKKVLVVLAVALLLAGGAVGVRALMSRDRPPAATGVATAAPPIAHAPRAAVAETPAEPLPAPVDLDKADRDLDLFGVVVDMKGGPVAGAAVTTFTQPWRRTILLNTNAPDDAPGPSTRSASDGTFSLRLRHGELVFLRAAKPGVGETEVPACQAGERLRVELRPAPTLVVTTVDAAGAPVEGTAIRVSGMGSRILRAERRGTTDARGECRITGLAPSAVVNVDAEPRRLAAPAWTRVDLPASGDVPLRLVLTDGRTLHGRVTDASTGAPIAGARIGISWTMRQAVTSDADGRYTLPGHAERGYYGLTCLAAGHASGWAVVQADDTIDFALKGADRLTARLVGTDGSPVAGALISVIGRESSQGAEAARSATSAADGTVAVVDLGHEQPHTLVVLANGHGRYILDFDPPSELGGTRDLGTVTLPAPRSVEGRVVAADGSPAAGVQVQLGGWNDDRGRLRPGRDIAASALYGRDEYRRTDDLGRFRFPDLSPGAYTVTASPDGGRAVGREVTLSAVANVRDVELKLSAGEPFTVIVEDTTGVAVSGIGVSVRAADDWTFGRITGVDGRAVVTPGAEVKSVSVTPWPGGRTFLPSTTVRVEPGAKEARVVVEEAATVTGVVLSPAGRPVGQAVIHVTCDGKPLATTPFEGWGSDAWTGWDGTFEIVVPKGKSVDLELSGYARADPSTMEHRGPILQGTARGVAAGTKDVVLRSTAVPTDRELTVLVFDPDGTPQVGAEVTVYAYGTGPKQIVGRTGRAYFKDLPACPVWVVARLPDDDPHRGDWLDASADKLVPTGQEVEVSFAQARRVAGVVLDPDGKPVEGATVSLYRDQKAFSERKSGKGGRFAVPVPMTDGGKLYLYVWDRPDPDRTWEFRQDGFQVTTDPLTIRLAPSAK